MLTRFGMTTWIAYNNFGLLLWNAAAGPKSGVHDYAEVMVAFLLSSAWWIMAPRAE